jgi:hypothetical protein
VGGVHTHLVRVAVRSPHGVHVDQSLHGDTVQLEGHGPPGQASTSVGWPHDAPPNSRDFILHARET